MGISVRVCELREIVELRECYRQEMPCQIIHDSIHSRAGWTVEHALELDGEVIGYGSLAVAGPWADSHALYEFYVKEGSRRRTFDLFTELLEACDANTIETQTNDPILTVMMHTFGKNVQAEAILFEDQFQTEFASESLGFRLTQAADTELLAKLDLDDGAKWVATFNGEIAGAGGVLYHYNRPYGDVYMKVAEAFRGRGVGAFLVQELKRACRAQGSVPAARCGTENVASRRTLQKAGFVPCGNLVTAQLVKTRQINGQRNEA